MMQLTSSAERSYQTRMEELSKDIWQVLDYYEHYKTIRGIYAELKMSGQLTKRQAVRLFDFIYDCEFDEKGNVKYYSKEDIEEAIKKIKKLYVFESVTEVSADEITNGNLFRQ